MDTTFCFVSGTSFLNFSPALVTTPTIDEADAIELIDRSSSSDLFFASLIRSGFDCCFLKLFFFSSVFFRILSLDLLWKESFDRSLFIFLSCGDSALGGDFSLFAGEELFLDGVGDGSRIAGEGSRLLGEGDLLLLGEGVFNFLSGEAFLEETCFESSVEVSDFKLEFLFTANLFGIPGFLAAGTFFGAGPTLFPPFFLRLPKTGMFFLDAPALLGR